MYGGVDPQPLLFHDSAITAFYVTLDALNRFQEHDAIGGNNYVIPALGLWFLTVESYVSTLYKVVQVDYNLAQHGRSPSTGSPMNATRLIEKFGAIEDYFMAPRPRPASPLASLREFATLRNTLFHDLTGMKRPRFTHTMFASQVEYVNEVDLMQGMITSIDVFTYFRHLFPDTDLMPSISLGVAFEKLDKLVAEVLFPSFSEIVHRKGLATALVCDLANDRIAAAAPLPLGLIIRYEGPLAPSSMKGIDRISTRHLDESRNRRPVPEGEFQVPNYAR